MDKEKLKKYIKNNKIISYYLEENENILKSEGYFPPSKNFTVKRGKRINIPKGYIRTAEKFQKLYHLNDLVESPNVNKNISYALQLSDFYNFILNRFNIWGSIEVMVYKQAFINVVSIMEALISESSNCINSFCEQSQCKNTSKCKNNISKQDGKNMKRAVERMFELGILDKNEVNEDRLKELYDLRNKIHIRLKTENEFLDQEYVITLYNESLETLKKVDKCLWKNAVPRYKKCMGYESKF